MLGGDLIPHPDSGPGEPAPGRALIWQLDPAEGSGTSGLGVRFSNDHDVVVTHHLDLIASDTIPPAEQWRSIIVVLASHPGDIHTAIDVGRVNGWIPIATSDPAEHTTTGYAIGVGISTT